MYAGNSAGLFEHLYREINGHSVSLSARRKKDDWYVGHTYGEVTYDGFRRMLSLVHPKKDEVFYDFGSGTGKPVYLAAMLTQLKKTVGIEILDELHNIAKGLLPVFYRLSGRKSDSLPHISFINGDFKQTDFNDADIIYISATCLPYEFDIPFIRRLEGLKKGTRIITNTIYFESDEYSVTNAGTVPFSWGEEEVFIHEKLV